MAFDGKTGSLRRPDGGRQNDAVDHFTAQFDGSALTMEVPTKLSRIRHAEITPMIGTVSANQVEQFHIAENYNTADGGYLVVPDDGEITINRQTEIGGTQLDDLRISVLLRGASADF